MKIYIIGLPGSGKTTLAKKISKKLDIKYTSLDKIYFTGRIENEVRDLKEIKKLINKLIKEKSWVIEGGYFQEWTKPILDKAEKIVFLEIPLKKLKKRVIRRYLKSKITGKEKHPFTRVKKLTKRYINQEREEKMEKEVMKKVKNKNKTIKLRNKKEINQFIKQLKCQL